ncbi:hypothetical protein ISF_06126 [Cordyceps fumosorosea ARSEF 2679]|uniref:Uncharacterized protein n=1 Tax=Cordyceps fumosorosea (strain ARSEF 2679) TaxID=1081104 RepID=A0A167T0A0_CORFA|nr:hypothetical protein ISF_06126 [Cordyceps fumosorosea ARSEF 2679]OAA60115.1 hypothetical protein ISF_06126 [Cordyceps fumosorosea ARSEF 2679]
MDNQDRDTNEGGQPKFLPIARSTPNAVLPPIQRNTLPAPPSYGSLYPSPPPPYESLYPCAPPAYETLPPPAYETLDSPPPAYDTIYPPPPPYSARARSLPSRPTLPPLCTILSSMGASPSSPPSPPPPYTSAPTTAARFTVYLARYYGAVDHDDSSRDRHALFVLTGAGRGVYLDATGSRRRGLRVSQTPGDAPRTRSGRLRESRVLGSVAAEDLDALWEVCRRVQQDRFPVAARPATKGGNGAAARTRSSLKSKTTPCRFLLYTIDVPPPPYSDAHGAELLASPSQEWVAAVIAQAQSCGLLQAR